MYLWEVEQMIWKNNKVELWKLGRTPKWMRANQPDLNVFSGKRVLPVS